MKKLIINLIFFTAILGAFFGLQGQIYAATTTISYAGTATDLGGSYPWTNVSNATGNTTSTSANASINGRNINSNTLSLTNFNLSTAGLPVGSTINGIQVDVERMVSHNRMRDREVFLTKDGINSVGSDYGNDSNGPTSKTTTTYGGLADLWGTTWSDTDLLSSNFGVLLTYRNTRNGTSDVDVYRVDVIIDYTPPPIPVGNPGGVSNNLQIWLKSDMGTSTTTDGNSLTTWNDQSGNGFHAGGGVSPTYYSTTTDLNYNPLVDFNGSTQYLENLNNGSYSQSYFAVIVPDNTVNGLLPGQTPFAFDCDSGILSSGTCGLTFAGLTLGAFTIAINDEVITHAIGSGTRWRSAQIGSASYQAAKPMLVHMNENAGGTGTEIHEKGNMLDNYNANPYLTLSAADYRIGMSSDAVNPFPYDGKIAEIINFSSPVSSTEQVKIESYLSLKYGMTLADGTTDYIASDGVTKMWGVASAGLYTNDIFGIGRDDNSGLGQVKSKSVHDDNIITLEAVGEGTNIAPSFVNMADGEFLSISNDDGGNSWVSTDVPFGYSNLSRKWRVQEVGEVGTLNLDFDVANVNFDVPALSLGTNYYFVYDSNNDGFLADETPQVMTNTSGSIWQIAGIDLDTGREFTISTQASTNNIPTNISISSNNIDENSAGGTTIGNFSTTDADLLDTHTYSFAIGTGDDDNSTFTIVGNVLSINVPPDYELKSQYTIRVETDDGNGGTFQKEFIIYVNDLPEIIDAIIDFEQLSDESKYTVTSGTWTRTTPNPFEGIYSIESNNGGLNNTQSCFEITNTFTSTGTVSFDYNVSSESGSDFMRFYIDNVEQQGWSGTVAWANYLKNDVSSGTHTYKWCYIKDTGGSAGTDKGYIDYIYFNSNGGDITPPTIISTNFSSGVLLPGGNHNIIITYSDGESGIDVSSDVVKLYKWNGSIWGSDISGTGLNLGSKIITSTSATYPTNNLASGKYMYEFSISDNDGNVSSTVQRVFYIDIPEMIISTSNLNIGTLTPGAQQFSSGSISITVKTIGAAFDVNFSKDTDFINTGSGVIIDWDGLQGVGYDQEVYTGINKHINNNPVLATEVANIDTNGVQQIYVYNIKIGTLIDTQQSAGNYSMNLSFYLHISY